MNGRNFKLNSFGLIDCDINHSELGLIPTTLDEHQSRAIISSGVEIAPYVKPVKTIGNIRMERNSLLAENVDIYNPLRWAELSSSQKAKVKAYRQALLDITKQDPTSVIWPEPPSI